jgi:hypothetical protein
MLPSCEKATNEYGSTSALVHNTVNLCALAILTSTQMTAHNINSRVTDEAERVMHIALFLPAKISYTVTIILPGVAVCISNYNRN